MSAPIGLEARAPEKGRAADCYAVAVTAMRLEHGGDKRYAKGNGHSLAPAAHACELHRISGALHRISEAECNGGTECPTCKGEGCVSGFADGTCGTCLGTGQRHAKKEHRLRAAANEIAEHYGLRCYFQTDPRGCALYLIDPADVPSAAELAKRDVSGACSPKAAEYLRSPEAWIESNYNRGHAVVRLGA